MFNETVLTNTEICIYINVICQERVFSFGFCQLPKTTENILSSRDLQNQVGGGLLDLTGDCSLLNHDLQNPLTA